MEGYIRMLELVSVFKFASYLLREISNLLASL